MLKQFSFFAYVMRRHLSVIIYLFHASPVAMVTRFSTHLGNLSYKTDGLSG